MGNGLKIEKKGPRKEGQNGVKYQKLFFLFDF